MLKTLYIKGMVCQRCIRVVENLLVSLNITDFTVQLGQVQLTETLDEQAFSTLLKAESFDLLHDQHKIITEGAKTLMIDLCNTTKLADLNTPLSYYLSEQLKIPYAAIGDSFKKTENRSIEQYWQCLRIEKTKELLDYNELSLEEISLQVGYLSQQALSKAFKKVTGISPRDYKKLELSQRKSLDKV